MSYTKQLTCDYCGISITLNDKEDVPTDWITLRFETSDDGKQDVYGIHVCDLCASTLMPTKVLTAWNPPPVKKAPRAKIPQRKH